MAKRKAKGSTLRIPTLTLHKATGQGRVRLDGIDVYLGKHGTPECEANYHRAIAEWLNRKASQVGTEERDDKDLPLSVARLIDHYLRFCEGYYVGKDGQPASAIWRIKGACEVLNAQFGNTKAEDFGPLKLMQTRDILVQQGVLCRKSINERIQSIVRMFKWGTAHELVPAGIYQALQAVEGLKRGRTKAKDRPKIKPVALEVVEATLPHCPPHVREMVQLQLLSGCRPGEIVLLRPMDIDTDGDVWLFTPLTHKTEHHDKERRIYFGPKAQDILRPLLEGLQPDDWVFSPRRSEAIRNAKRGKNRQTPRWPSHMARNLKKRMRPEDRDRQPKARYTTNSYRRAILRACEFAFEMPAHLTGNSIYLTCKKLEEPEKSNVGEKLREQANIWRERHCWSPNQLRHTRATELRKEVGVDAASVILGHSGLQVTAIYAEADEEKARRIMREHG